MELGLFLLLKEDTDQEILAVIIVAIQDLTKKKFGLKEDNETGVLLGEG